MDNVNNVASAATETPAPLEPDEIIEQLRALRARIPDYGPLTVERSRALHNAARADATFVQAAINSVGASEPMRQALGMSADDLRQAVDGCSRWSAVEDELRAMLDGVAASNLRRRHQVGLTVLQAYSIGRQLVRKDQHSDLIPHVKEMRRLNRFGRRRKTAQPQPPAPVPTP